MLGCKAIAFPSTKQLVGALYQEANYKDLFTYKLIYKVLWHVPVSVNFVIPGKQSTSVQTC